MEWVNYHRTERGLRDLESKLPPDCLLPFITGSFGDVYGVLALIEKVVEKKECSVHALIDKSYALLATRYSGDRISFSLIDSEQQLRNYLQTYRSRFAFIPGEIYPTLPTVHPLIGEAVLTRRITVTEAWRLILGLPRGESFSQGKIGEDRIKALNLVKAGLNGQKNVLLFPSAQSNTPLSIPLLSFIVESLTKSGWSVYLNTRGAGRDGLLDSKCLNYIDVPPDLLIEISESFNLVISAPSGVSAILSMIPNQSRVRILHSRHNVNKVSTQEFGYSLENMSSELGPDFIKTNNIRDINWSPDGSDWDLLLRDLVSDS